MHWEEGNKNAGGQTVSSKPGKSSLALGESDRCRKETKNMQTSLQFCLLAGSVAAERLESRKKVSRTGKEELHLLDLQAAAMAFGTS